MLSRGTRKELTRIVGRAHLELDESELALYGYDATPQMAWCPPEAVVLPDSAEQVAAVVRLANREGFAVVARGAGTNLTGGARPLRGGVVISTQRMNKILAIDERNLQAVVQPGVVTEDLQDAVAERGLFYPPDPQSRETCTIGGNLAENAGGPRAVKYGVTRQYALGLQAVLPLGELVRLGARTVKSVVGYDLVSLLVGSEGTLGVITEATLRLVPQPEARRTLLAVFDDLEQAARTVSSVLQAKLAPSALEFIDRESIRCLEAHRPAGLPRGAEAVLVIEVDGGRTEMDASARRVEEVCRRCGASHVERAEDERAAERLWKARRSIGPALARIAPLRYNEDIVVPIARLSEAVGGIHTIAKRLEVACACFGHAGDGTIHISFLVQPDDENLLRRVEQAVDETFDLVVSLDGSITAEHGVGTTKQPYVSKELSAEVIDAMRRIKAALDPNDVMNPGKILFADEEAGDGP